jgi:hypothetical protein
LGGALKKGDDNRESLRITCIEKKLHLASEEQLLMSVGPLTDWRYKIPGLITLAVCVATLLLGGGNRATAQSLTPLASFGGITPGWRQPGEPLAADVAGTNDGFSYLYMQASNNERGLAYGNGHLYLVSHANVNGSTANVRILDGLSGADLGGLNNTGIAGGTFALNAGAVGGDGSIYVANLTTQSTTTPFTVYKWDNEGAAPIVAYTGDAGLPGSRVGDSLAGVGSGTSTRIAAGFSNNPSVTGNNGYTIIDPTAGAATAVGFSSPPNPGDFRLGLSFGDSTHVFSKPISTTTLYYTSYSGAAGNLDSSATLPAAATAETELAYTVLNGTPLLATQSSGDSHISVYSVADPANPVLLASAAGLAGLMANLNNTGQIAWGDATINPDGSATQNLYGMRSNGGIRAFTFTLPAPGLDGDYNDNGVVDAADYVVWKKNVGLMGGATKADGDGNGDGDVTSDDYEYWRARFGNTSAGSGASALAASTVPEPTTIAMLMMSLFIGASGRARRARA